MSVRRSSQRVARRKAVPAAPAAVMQPAVPRRDAGKTAHRSFSGVAIALTFALALFAVWAVGATYLLVSGNRLAANAVDRTFQVQDYYEQQGAEFRRILNASKAEYERVQRDLTRLEQVANERTGVEGRLVELVRRQTQLESRQSAMVRLVEQVSGAPVAAVQAAASAPIPPRRPSVLAERTRSILGEAAPDPAEPDMDFDLDPDAELLAAPPDEHGALEPPAAEAGMLADGASANPKADIDVASDPLGESRAVQRKRTPPRPAQASLRPAGPVPQLGEQSITELASLLLRRVQDLEASQMRDAHLINSGTAQRAALLKQAAETAGRELADIVEPTRMKAVRAVIKIAKPAAEDGSPFGVALSNIRTNVVAIKRLAPVVNGLPLRQPVSASSRISSRFGPRSDPFLRTARFHAGQDFAAATGTPIYSTGGGVVLSAGWGGGYGNLVQVDHGNGLVTRYAHLSELNVTVGQPVAAGQIVGKAGSTGRSTGPHLHYETRLNNVPNDPMRLMRVGAQLGLSGGPPGMQASLLN
ncbi:MAG: peptidoglycan DD-metalloendopeptidase family protein [Beijerinckiaceae bacterium]